MTLARAASLSPGATESSRSRLITSASDAAIFSKIAGREPGPKSWQRFGRAGGLGWMRNDMGRPSVRILRGSSRQGYELARGSATPFLHLRKARLPPDGRAIRLELDARASQNPPATPAARKESAMIETPYLLFLGDAPDPLAAKVAQGIKDWRPEYAVGQLRLEGCRADMGIPDMTLAEAKAAGVRTVVIGVANRGGVISQTWKKVLVQALEEGFDLASGLHNLLRDEEDLAAVARATGARCTTCACRR
jgi:hypothetical protein